MNMQQLLVMGRAKADGEVLESKDGKKYARVIVRVSEYLGKDKEERTTEYTCKILNKTAEQAGKIQKGDLVMVDGKPDIDVWLTNEGECTGRIIVVADRWKVLK